MICKNCEWEIINVSIENQCVNLMRCKHCKKFGHAYVLSQEPYRGSIAVGKEELPSDFREYLEEIVKQIESYPIYDL